MLHLCYRVISELNGGSCEHDAFYLKFL